MQIIKEGQIKVLPALLLKPNGDQLIASTLEASQECGWAEYIAPEQLPPTPEEVITQKVALVALISEAARNYVESQANAALQDQLWSNYKSATPHPMAVAVINWGKSVYMAAEARKLMVSEGVEDDAQWLSDFSSFGEKPYTVYQLYVAGVVEL